MHRGLWGPTAGQGDSWSPTLKGAPGSSTGEDGSGVITNGWRTVVVPSLSPWGLWDRVSTVGDHLGDWFAGVADRTLPIGRCNGSDDLGKRDGAGILGPARWWPCFRLTLPG